MSLEELGKKYGTLKVQHGYLPIYERFLEPFKWDGINLLEIGVHKGASLMMWADYLRGGGSIVGIDKFLTPEAKKLSDKTYFQLIEGDACNNEFKFEIIVDGREYKFDYDFDVIIDDGSHIASEQIATFNNLWKNLNPGGLYCIEDLFTLYDPVWNPEGPNILDLINSRQKSILVGGDEIQEVHYFGRNDINGLLILRKRYEPFRIQPLEEFNEPA